MHPPDKKAKHLAEARYNDLIRKHKKTSRNKTKERRRDAWTAISDIIKENSDILMNTKGRVRTLEENKVVLLVLYCELEIALAQYTSDSDIYGTGMTEHKLFQQTSATLRMDRKEVRRLYYYFTSEETGRTLDSIRPVYDNSLQGKGSPNSKFHGKGYGNTHRTPSGKMDLRIPEDEHPNFVIGIKKVDCFKLIKKSIKCANDRVAAVPGIYGSVDGNLQIDAY